MYDFSWISLITSYNRLFSFFSLVRIYLKRYWCLDFKSALVKYLFFVTSEAKTMMKIADGLTKEEAVLDMLIPQQRRERNLNDSYHGYLWSAEFDQIVACVIHDAISGVNKQLKIIRVITSPTSANESSDIDAWRVSLFPWKNHCAYIWGVNSGLNTCKALLCESPGLRNQMFCQCLQLETFTEHF